MPTFTPSGTLVQSTNAKYITFTDTSVSPPANLYTRKLLIADGRNNFIKTVTIPDGSPSVSFTIDKDAYLNITLLWVDEDSNEYRTTFGQMSLQFFALALLYNYEHPKCGTRRSCDDDLFKAILCKDTAVTYFEQGQAEDAQEAIEAATLLIKAAPEGYGDTISKTIPVVHEIEPEVYDRRNPVITIQDNPIYINGKILTL